MNKLYIILILVLIALTSVNYAAPRGKILTKAVTPNTLTQFTTNSISTGLTTIPKGTYSYLAPLNVGDTSTISSVTWSFVSIPAGSNSVLTNLANQWVQFLADTNGTYVVNMHIITSTGTHDTTINIVSSYFVGVGNFDGVSAIWPQCMTCHASMPQFAAIFNTWQNTPHATLFKTEVNIPVSAGGHYTSSCFPCHTIGTDNHIVINNGGFDDVAKQLGFVWNPNTANAGSWDTIKMKYPSLVNFATIGCENCHGAGKEHAATEDVSKIAISLDAGVCQSCHDAPWRHDKGTLWNYSVHSTAIWNSSFAQTASSQNNNLGNCIRCHDAQGFINFSNNVTTNTTGWTIANHNVISCQTCHNPHGTTNQYELRKEPIASDTLGNGYNYSNFGGLGNICINCHKARKDNVSYIATSTTVNSTWGPHHGTQADNLLGLNAAAFSSQAFVSGDHQFAVTNACVDCHMASTVTSDTLYKYQVGGHSWNMNYTGLNSLGVSVNYDNTQACVTCHGSSKTHFSDWQAAMDYDGNGVVQDVQTEVKGLLAKLALALPHNADGSFNYAQITTQTQMKAYWNYQLIDNDGSFGIHNAKFAFDVLTKSLAALGQTTPVELTTFTAATNNTTVNLTWQTATETNNQGFNVERANGNSFVKIGFVSGKGTSTVINNYTYTDQVGGNGNYVYRLTQVDFDGKFSYSKQVSVDVTGGPTTYSLSQNYPNPFNPSTIIKFALPFDSNVKLTIYNITGQVVRVLVNGAQSAGSHEVTFNFNENGVNVSSGIYFYTLEASANNNKATYRETKKMVLMK
jgi:hypothetical protein